MERNNKEATGDMGTVLHDADIRDDLCVYLEELHGKVRFFDELTMGKSRADIVMVTEEGLIGVEIKSDADTYDRLARQVKDYDRFFDKNMLRQEPATRTISVSMCRNTGGLSQ